MIDHRLTCRFYRSCIVFHFAAPIDILPPVLNLFSYLYGGFGFPDPLAFNDVYILSLPSFQWIKAYNLDAGAPSPDPAGHGGCSANVVNRDQMIIIGGWFGQQGAPPCDSPDTQGLHNMILGNNTDKRALWDQYDPKLSKYEVPAVVVAAIGGG